MKLAETARLFAANTIWRGLHWKAPGRALIRGLKSPDENNRMISGMFLVKSGQRAVPLLREALARKESLPLVIRIIADLGAKEFRPDLERLSKSEDPEVAAAAKDAMRLLGT
ncbi:MAG TPA: hypothetical protein VEU96_12765 [Bryobacteraceae bacterium]|nr:hypothetical protein [Bryobacteraceae bacterium]